MVAKEAETTIWLLEDGIYLAILSRYIRERTAARRATLLPAVDDRGGSQEQVMKQHDEVRDSALIDLGAASIETKGPPQGEIQDVLGEFPASGLSNS